MNRTAKYFLFNFVMGLAFTSIPFLSHSDDNKAEKLNNNAFQFGEKIDYNIYYNSLLTGNVKAGNITLQVKDQPAMVNNHRTMHILGTAETSGAFSFFFKVKNRYESFIDEKGLIPIVFRRKVREGSYKKDQQVRFDHRNNLAISEKAQTPISDNVQDIFSAFYYMRTHNYDTASVGDIYYQEYFHNDKVYLSRIIFEGREVIETDNGTFRTLRFRPEVLMGDVFGKKYPMTIWVSDDENKMIVLMESALNIGSIKMEIQQHKGLKNPLTSYLEK